MEECWSVMVVSTAFHRDVFMSDPQDQHNQWY